MSTSSPTDELLNQECGAKCLPLLRARFRQRKVGIMVGAGISMACGVPSWAGLVDRVRKISKEPRNHLKKFKNGADATFLTEVAWRRFRKERTDHYKSSHPDERYREAIIEGEWLGRVKEVLFQDVDDVKIKNHPYLTSLAKVVHGCSFNISFNFDNILDLAVAEHAASINEQLPTTTATIAPIDRQHGATIFHINGLMPREAKKPTELVFSEEAFAKILTTEDIRKKEYLLNQLADKTFILVGLSLNDKSLTNMLRASKDRNPGCHHFYVIYTKNRGELTRRERREIYDANLHVYNLITLFLCDEDINRLFELIYEEPGGKADIASAKSGSKMRYVYYIVGCPAAGKTTLLENLRCFLTIEEWTQRIPEIMYQNYSKLTPDQQRDIDLFLDTELVRKGNKTRRNDLGITVVDRAPLDLYAFSKKASDNVAKTINLKNAVIPALGGCFDDGHIIFLKASAEQLALRQARRGRATSDMNYTGEDLERQGKKLLNIYNPPTDQIFDNSNQTELVTALRISRHILFDEYRPADFLGIMQRCLALGGNIGISRENIHFAPDFIPPLTALLATAMPSSYSELPTLLMASRIPRPEAPP